MQKEIAQRNVYQLGQGLGRLKPGVLVTLFSAMALLVGHIAAQGTLSQRPHVLTTVAPLTNIAKNVGGPSIELHGLVPGGTDSHTFEPAPSDIRYIAEADVIILNGLDLEVPTEKLALANKKPGASILKLGDRTITPKEYVFDRSFPKSGGHPNPYLWMNPIYAIRYAELVRDALAGIDPTNATTYQARTQQFIPRLHELDRSIAAAVATIPPKHRKPLTYHDSCAYFAPRYGLTVIGAIEPASFSEPSPQEVARVIRQLKQEKLPAVFGSEVFPSKVLDQIAGEAGVQFIATLRDDDLPGEPGSSQHSYIGMMLENVRTMVTALGGRADVLQRIDPADLPWASAGRMHTRSSGAQGVPASSAHLVAEKA